MAELKYMLPWLKMVENGLSKHAEVNIHTHAHAQCSHAIASAGLTQGPPNQDTSWNKVYISP